VASKTPYSGFTGSMFGPELPDLETVIRGPQGPSGVLRGPKEAVVKVHKEVLKDPKRAL